jgi:hypothetical protein
MAARVAGKEAIWLSLLLNNFGYDKIGMKHCFLAQGGQRISTVYSRDRAASPKRKHSYSSPICEGSRESVQGGIQGVATCDQVADFLTKTLAYPTFV